MNPQQTTVSLSKRLTQSWSVRISAGFLCLLSLLALFAYFLAPDHSPDANRQIVEIQSQHPGFRMPFLRIPISVSPSGSWWNRLWSGQPDTHRLIPYSSLQVTDSVVTLQPWVNGTSTSLLRLAADTFRVAGPLREANLTETKHFWLGTDLFGRDVLSRLLVGARISLAAGWVAVCISLFIGTLLGMLAGYYRKRVDAIVGWFINVTWSIPTILLVFAITLALGKGIGMVFVAIGVTMWVPVARLVRGQVLAVKEMEYVQAARVLGFSDRRILLKHILPNISGPLLVLAANQFATAILLEAGLSFLGLGVQPPTPSWGSMIRENYAYVLTNNPWLALAPGLAILLTVLSVNLLGNALRDALDVKGS
jgi:peptide/nickel transport system permease protein